MSNSISFREQPSFLEEIVQARIRIGFVLVVLVVMAIAPSLGLAPATTWQYVAMATFFCWSIVYLFYIRNFPCRHCTVRRYLSIFTDLSITAFMFIIAGELSAIFPAVFLWLIVGYGIRYGTAYSNVAMLVTAVYWSLICNYSPYWSAQPYQCVGWLVAFLLVPLYFFVLVRRLHRSLKKLSETLERTEQIANYDNLTQLANRSFFDRELMRFVDTYNGLAIMIMDLDGFKKVNDTYGHKKGDEVLIRVAEILKHQCCDDVIAGRLGGDEFIICAGDKDQAEVELFCNGMLKKIHDESDSNSLITASVGISFYPDEGDDISHVKGLADAAMYEAKHQGKNRYVFNSPSSNAPSSNAPIV